MPTITALHARSIWDSRGNPTVEVDLEVDNKIKGRGVAPSGASTGQFEALERRDGGKPLNGKGVKGVCSQLNQTVFPELLKGKKFQHSFEIDEFLTAYNDEAQPEHKIGSNGLLSVSIALARAMANFEQKYLFAYLAQFITCCKPAMPKPFMNVLNGGVHAHNGLRIQEFMIVPQMNASITERLNHAAEVIYALKSQLVQEGHSTNVGDEGGFAPAFQTSREALTFLMRSIEKAGYRPGEDIALALDVAANECLGGDDYVIDGERYNTNDMISFYGSLIKDFPIVSIEDALRDDDPEGWKNLTQAHPKTQWVGDDLFVTQKSRIIDMHDSANAILLKPNQVGTLWGTFQTWEEAHKRGYAGMASHRSGETEDTSIAHVAVAMGCGQIKVGSLARTDRTCKYNELIRIEEVL